MVINTSDVLAPSSISSPNKQSHKPAKIKTKDYYDQVIKNDALNTKARLQKHQKVINLSQSLLVFFA